MPTDSNQPGLIITSEDGRTIVRFADCTSLNEFTSDRIGQLLVDLGNSKSDQHVVLEMSTIQYLTSTVLGHLLVLHKRLATGGGRLTLENCLPAVRDVLRVTLLDQVLDVRPVDQAAV